MGKQQKLCMQIVGALVCRLCSDEPTLVTPLPTNLSGQKKWDILNNYMKTAEIVKLVII